MYSGTVCCVLFFKDLEFALFTQLGLHKQSDYTHIIISDPSFLFNPKIQFVL